jgi:hypothetical protein
MTAGGNFSGTRTGYHIGISASCQPSTASSIAAPFFFNAGLSYLNTISNQWLGIGGYSGKGQDTTFIGEIPPPYGTLESCNPVRVVYPSGSVWFRGSPFSTGGAQNGVSVILTGVPGECPLLGGGVGRSFAGTARRPAVGGTGGRLPSGFVELPPGKPCLTCGQLTPEQQARVQSKVAKIRARREGRG